jgi:hypothetical protein
VKRSLDQIERVFGFSVLVGTESATLEGERIIGKWAAHPRVWRGGKPTLTERFLGVPSWDPDSILRFTKDFGPLTYPLEKWSEGGAFEFSLKDWAKKQSGLFWWWDSFAARVSLPSTTVVAPVVVETTARDQFQIGRGSITFRCANIEHYIGLEIATLPPELLRTCLNTDCNRRFIARDSRERYCSDKCSATGRNRAKLRYWNEHKEEFLEDRKQQRAKDNKKRRRKHVASQKR